MDTELLNDGMENTIQETEDAEVDPSFAALVAALRIFAARGRTIRKERGRVELVPCDPPGVVDNEGVDVLPRTVGDARGT